MSINEENVIRDIVFGMVNKLATDESFPIIPNLNPTLSTYESEDVIQAIVVRETDDSGDDSDTFSSEEAETLPPKQEDITIIPKEEGEMPTFLEDKDTNQNEMKQPNTVAAYFAISGVNWDDYATGQKNAKGDRAAQCKVEEVEQLSSLDLQDKDLNNSPKKLTATLLDRYPQRDYSDISLDGKAFEFCFPTGVHLSQEPIAPKFHSFTLTGETSRMIHAACLTVYEPLDMNHLQKLLAQPTLPALLASRRYGSSLYEKFADFLHDGSNLPQDVASARLQILSQVDACTHLPQAQQITYCSKLANHFFGNDDQCNRDEEIDLIHKDSNTTLSCQIIDIATVSQETHLASTIVRNLNTSEKGIVVGTQANEEETLNTESQDLTSSFSQSEVHNGETAEVASNGDSQGDIVHPKSTSSSIHTTDNKLKCSKLLRDASIDNFCDLQGLITEYYSMLPGSEICLSDEKKAEQSKDMKSRGEQAFELVQHVYRATIESVQEAFETWSKTEISSSTLYCPKALMILSKWPLYSLFQELLMAIHKAGTLNPAQLPVPLERSIMHVLKEVPEPPPGKYRVRFKLHSNQKDFFSCSRPPLNRLPLHSLPLRTLFERLDINKMLTLFNCTLLEFRVVLVSSDLAVLSEVGAALRCLLFPLTWQSPYIPVLPESMLDVVYAPCPFIVGVHASIAPQDSLVKDDVVYVDLDNNSVDLPSSDEFLKISPMLLSRVARKLKKQIYGEHVEPLPKGHTAPVRARASRTSIVLPTKKRGSQSEEPWGALIDADMNEFNEGVREVFLDFFAKLLQNYQGFMGGWEAGLDELFDREGFVESHEESATSSAFLGRLVDTQMMQMFVEDRVFAAERNFEVMLFDAHIDRIFGGKSERMHSSGSFLEDTSQYVREDHIVQPPIAEQATTSSATQYPQQNFPPTLHWAALPEPQDVPCLITVLRGPNVVRESNSVTDVLESVYLNFYTKKRAFKSRFKFAKGQAEAGLRDVQDLLKLFTNEAVALQAFSKILAKITTERLTFAYHNDPNDYMSKSLWPALIKSTSEWGVVAGILGRDLENHVCGRLREVFRLLSNQLRLLTEEEAERLREITVAKASMERAKQNKEMAISDMEQCEKLYRKAASASVSSMAVANCSGDLQDGESLDTRAVQLERGTDTLERSDSASSLMAETAPSTVSDSQPSSITSPRVGSGISPVNEENQSVNASTKFNAAKERIVSLNNSSTYGKPSTPVLVNTNELQKLANRKVACSRAVESTSVVFSEEVAALARELARFTVSTSAILGEFHQDESFRIESLQKVLSHATELHLSVVKVLVQQIEKSIGASLSKPLEEALEMPRMPEDGEEAFDQWVTRTRVAKNVCKSFLDFGEARVTAFQTLSTQLMHVSGEKSVGKGMQQQGSSLQRALKSIREGVHDLGDGLQAPAQSSRTDLLNPIVELRKELKLGFHALSSQRQAQKKKLSAANAQRRKAESRLERMNEAMQNCAEELANLSNIKRHLIAGEEAGEEQAKPSVPFPSARNRTSLQVAGASGKRALTRAIDAVKSMAGGVPNSASSYNGRQEKLAARLEVCATEQANAQNVLDSMRSNEEKEVDAYGTVLDSAFQTFHKEEKNRVEVVTARCRTLMSNELAMLSRFSATCEGIADLVKHINAAADLAHRVELDKRAAVFTQTALKPFSRDGDELDAQSKSVGHDVVTGLRAEQLGKDEAGVEDRRPSLGNVQTTAGSTDESRREEHESGNSSTVHHLGQTTDTEFDHDDVVDQTQGDGITSVKLTGSDTKAFEDEPVANSLLPTVSGSRPFSFVRDLWNGEGMILQRYRDVVMRLKSIQWHVSGFAQILEKAEGDLMKQLGLLMVGDGGMYIKKLREQENFPKGELLEEASSRLGFQVPSPLIHLLLRLYDSIETQATVFRGCAQTCSELSTRARTLKRELKGIMKIHVDQKRKLDADLSRANLNVDRAKEKSEKLNSSLAAAEGKLRMTSPGTQVHKQLEDRVFQLRDSVEIARRQLQECNEVVYNTLCKNNNCVSQQLTRLEERQLRNLEQCRAILESFVEIEKYLLVGWLESPLLLKAPSQLLARLESRCEIPTVSLAQLIAKEMTLEGPRSRFFEGISGAKLPWQRLKNMPSIAIKDKLKIGSRASSSTSIRSFTPSLKWRRHSAPSKNTTASMPKHLQRPISPSSLNASEESAELEQPKDGAFEDVPEVDLGHLWKGTSYSEIEQRLVTAKQVAAKLNSVLLDLTTINTRVGVEWLEIQRGFPIMINLLASNPKGHSKGFDNQDVCVTPTSMLTEGSTGSLSPGSTRSLSARGDGSTWNLNKDDGNQPSFRSSIRAKVNSIRQTVKTVMKEGKTGLEKDRGTVTSFQAPTLEMPLNLRRERQHPATETDSGAGNTQLLLTSTMEDWKAGKALSPKMISLDTVDSVAQDSGSAEPEALEGASVLDIQQRGYDEDHPTNASPSSQKDMESKVLDIKSLDVTDEEDGYTTSGEDAQEGDGDVTGSEATLDSASAEATMGRMEPPEFPTQVEQESHPDNQFDELSLFSSSSFRVYSPQRREQSTLHESIRVMNRLWTREAKSFVKCTTGFTKSGSSKLKKLVVQLSERINELHHTKRAVMLQRKTCESALEKAVSQLRKCEESVATKEPHVSESNAEDKRARKLRAAHRKLAEAKESLKLAEDAFASGEEEYLKSAGHVASLGVEMEDQLVELACALMEEGKVSYSQLCSHLGKTEKESREAVNNVDIHGDLQEFIDTHRTGLSPPWESMNDSTTKL